MGTYIKVCGLTNTDDAIMASKLNINAIGFNLFEKSKRYSRDVLKQIKKTCCINRGVWEGGV